METTDVRDHGEQGANARVGPSQAAANDPGLYWSELGIALQERYQRVGLAGYLDQAIEMHEGAIRETNSDQPSLPSRLNNLGSARQLRYELAGSFEDLERAITLKKQAIELTPESDPNRAVMLSNLGNSFESRFYQTGRSEDLDSAIASKDLALKSIPGDHPFRAPMLSNLANAIKLRFEQDGVMEDLDRSITAHEHACALIPKGHPSRGIFWTNWGTAVMLRFECSGSKADLDHVIAIEDEALESTTEPPLDRAICLNNLGIVLQARFKHIGSTDDLDRAIALSRESLTLVPDAHSCRPIYLNNLGTALWRKYQRFESPEDLKDAIINMEEAVKLTPVGHHCAALHLNNFGNALTSSFEFDRAIQMHERAVEAYDRNTDSGRGMYVNNLAGAVYRRFQSTGSKADLDRAIELGDQVIVVTPDGHPTRAMYFLNLGSRLRKRFELTASRGDLEGAVVAFEQALHSETSPPSLRLEAAWLGSEVFVQQKMYDRAKPFLATAVRLLPLVSPRSLNRKDQQFNISQFANLTSLAASLHIAAGEDPYETLQLLEIGRGIIQNLQLELRSDISLLAESQHADMAQKFQELRDRLDPPSRGTSGSMISEDSPTIAAKPEGQARTVRECRDLSKGLENLLITLRDLPGFENFLRGPSKSELRSLSQRGAIVIFNVSVIRSDALLVTSQDIRVIPLPLLTTDSLISCVRRFVAACKEQQQLGHYNRSRVELNAVLKWIWEVAAKVVLDSLGFTRAVGTDEPWPRVWWVGSGLLNILPIHAAGYHDGNLCETVLDRVVSQYTSTVKALYYAWQRVMEAKGTVSEKALVVGMPTTPDKEPLNKVPLEIQQLVNIFSNIDLKFNVRQCPTRLEVLLEIPGHTIVHFACHGVSFAADPSLNHLLLADWKQGPLTVSDLMDLNVPRAKFAYLSACHTAVTGDLNLLEESINLASAIQLSGYPSVIGSLWQVTDKHSIDVATDVYKWALADNGRFDCDQAAMGLHRAIRKLRQRTHALSRSGNDPWIWAPYVSTGW
jgi:tetratricopeptide (TPR) repeat protein